MPGNSSEHEMELVSQSSVLVLQADKQQLLLTLDKERRANAIAGAARSDAGWKVRFLHVARNLCA